MNKLELFDKFLKGSSIRKTYWGKGQHILIVHNNYGPYSLWEVINDEGNEYNLTMSEFLNNGWEEI